MVFNNENETYDEYNSYMLAKGSGVHKCKTTKFRTHGETIRRQFVCNKRGHKKCVKRLEGQDVLFPRDTLCACPARKEIILIDMAELVLVKFIAKHNHPLSTTPSKSRMHQSHSTVHRSNAVRQTKELIPRTLQEFAMQPVAGRNKILPHVNAVRSLEVEKKQRRKRMFVHSKVL